MSLLDFRLPKRYEGEYNVKIKKYTPIENENGGYVALILDLGENEELKFNMFPSNFKHWSEGLQMQFLGETNNETKLLEMIVQATRDSFKAQINWSEKYNRYNINVKPQQSNEIEDAIDLY